MISETEYYISCIAEECAEVAERASKAIRFGLFEVQPGQDLNNWQRMAQEFDDLQAAFDMLCQYKNLLYETELSAFNAKKAKIREYLDHAKKVGQIT